MVLEVFLTQEFIFSVSQSLILARFSGALAVCSSSDLKNKLGDAAEQLDSAPRLTPRFGKGFLALEVRKCR